MADWSMGNFFLERMHEFNSPLLYKVRKIGICLFLLILLSGCTRPAEDENVSSSMAITPKIPLFVTLAKGETVQFNVEVVEKEEDRERGLMFRNGLPKNEGMLFKFEQLGQLSFWMKNMLIPLDMIFIDVDYKVVQILNWVMPCEDGPCPKFGSLKDAQYVLEINGGLSAEWGIHEGARVRW